ncbi:hypothetical protein BJV82DRAFT_312314 [Fennellomyces sp. T-0311]|nr:hypothetical protein BJV82DRAFT_312314 [Fennellomyces sp. T-0311]
MTFTRHPSKAKGFLFAAVIWCLFPVHASTIPFCTIMGSLSIVRLKPDSECVFCKRKKNHPHYVFAQRIKIRKRPTGQKQQKKKQCWISEVT